MPTRTPFPHARPAASTTPPTYAAHPRRQAPTPRTVEPGLMLVWNSPRREGMLPAGDKRGNWNVTWFPADVWPGLGMSSIYWTV